MLKINNLNVNLEEMELIKEANLEISSGELILIEGENGSGKSSLMRGIFKYPGYKISSGQIIIDNEDITNAGVEAMAKIGMYLGLQNVPEIEGISTLSLLYKAYKNINENNNLSAKDFKDSLIKECEMFGLDTDLLTRDLNVGFSGGEKKQADLIHILALKPKYIFLDEPDSGVDKVAIEKVYKVIEHMRSIGSAVALISHSKEVEKLNINRIYKIENGLCSIKK